MISQNLHFSTTKQDTGEAKTLSWFICGDISLTEKFSYHCLSSDVNNISTLTLSFFMQVKQFLADVSLVDSFNRFLLIYRN